MVIVVVCTYNILFSARVPSLSLLKYNHVFNRNTIALGAYTRVSTTAPEYAHETNKLLMKLRDVSRLYSGRINEFDVR